MAKLVKEGEKTPEERIKLPHHRARDFASHYVTGAILSESKVDDMFHLIFYADAIGVKSETGIKIEGEENAYKAAIEDDDLYQFREDKARISVSKKTLLALWELIGTKLNKESGQG